MKKDIRYVPTPPAVVAGIMELAGVGVGDVLHDLGSGDGRLVVAAAELGARGIGTDLDPSLVERSRVLALEAGVERQTEFRLGNFFDADVSDATVVTLYLFHNLNRALMPKLQREMRAGSRLISHSFGMGDWKPDREIEVESKILYLWTMP